MRSKHRQDTCSHKWIHNAGKQCEWDNWSLEDSIRGIKPEQYKKDSNNLCYFYICTMCGEEMWSQTKLFNIPHYRVREE